jgi:hypothetical protein
MKRSNLGWRTVSAVGLATLIFGLGIAVVIPARAAPGGGAGAPNQDVTVTNTPLPVTGTVGAQPLLPARPFTATVFIDGGDGPQLVGPFVGTLGVGAITITNFDSSVPVQVEVQAVLVTGGTTCQTATPAGGSIPDSHFLVDARQTVHATYPTPMVFSPLGGNTCVQLSVNTTHTGTVMIAVNGSVQP